MNTNDKQMYITLTDTTRILLHTPDEPTHAESTEHTIAIGFTISSNNQKYLLHSFFNSVYTKVSKLYNPVYFSHSHKCFSHAKTCIQNQIVSPPQQYLTQPKHNRTQLRYCSQACIQVSNQNNSSSNSTITTKAHACQSYDRCNTCTCDECDLATFIQSFGFFLLLLASIGRVFRHPLNALTIWERLASLALA